ncbi:hypothetical protein MRX96_039248 [Rhipicephalus microplus]
MASCILASGRGCPPDIALRFLNAVASARVFYAVPLIGLRPAQWDALDTLHRGVVRLPYTACHARRRSAPPWQRLARCPFHSEYAALAPEPPYCGWLLIPPHQDPGLEITTTVPSIRSKRNTPQPALHQETAAMIEERLAGRVLLYTDGLVTADGSVAPTCFAPSLGLREKCQLPTSASSTAA